VRGFLPRWLTPAHSPASSACPLQSKVPGTTEYGAIHPTSGGPGNFVRDRATGEVREHRTAVGTALDSAAQRVKAVIPGTHAHKVAAEHNQSINHYSL
jgi:hypothetical protein